MENTFQLEWKILSKWNGKYFPNGMENIFQMENTFPGVVDPKIRQRYPLRGRHAGRYYQFHFGFTLQ